jgi:hypothetical protein
MLMSCSTWYKGKEDYISQIMMRREHCSVASYVSLLPSVLVRMGYDVPEGAG